MRMLLLMTTLVAGISFGPTPCVRGDDDDDRWERAETREWFRAREVERQAAIREWNKANREAAREWEKQQREFIKERNKRIRAQFREDQKHLREQYERYGILPYEYQYPTAPYWPGEYSFPSPYDDRFNRGGSNLNQYELIPPPPPAAAYGAIPSGWYEGGRVWVPQDRAYRQFWRYNGAYNYGDLPMQ